jgi:hypothetical protein
MTRTLQHSRRAAIAAGIAVVAVLTAPRDIQAKAPAGRYTFPASGVVYDTATKLTWQQAPLSGDTFSQTDAVNTCRSLTFNNEQGWRLPTVKELETLIDFSQPGSPSTAMIDPTAFPNTPPVPEWTSTLYVSSSGSAWAIDFMVGFAINEQTTTTEIIRCVK